MVAGFYIRYLVQALTSWWTLGLICYPSISSCLELVDQQQTSFNVSKNILSWNYVFFSSSSKGLV